jgi:hypothetical protein
MSASKKAYYQGVRFAPYDLVREFIVALAVVSVLVVILAFALSSPDEPPLTLKSVAQQTPQIYAATSIAMLDGTGAITGYGPPYNNGSGSVQSIGPLSIQKLFGVRIPINTAQDYVLGPLAKAAVTDAAAKSALAAFNSAGPKQQAAWESAYETAIQSPKVKQVGSTLILPSCSGCGPVAPMMATLLRLGQSGAMDGLLLTSNQFYQTDYTRPLLFMQNDAVANHAAQFNLLSSTWGVMNETGNYPGQAWLWLYTMLYQIPPWAGVLTIPIIGSKIDWTANADAMAVFTVTILTLILIFLPWIPGLNRLPKFLRVYRLIWKDYYREQHPQRTPASHPATAPSEGKA